MKDNEPARRWPSRVEKVINHPSIQEEDDGKEFEDARSRDNLNLEIRLSDGKRKFFSLVGLEAEFDSGGSADTLKLHFVRAEVTVTGRALIGLYEKLLDQRARFIEQHTEAEGELLGPDVPYVEQIEIERKEDY